MRPMFGGDWRREIALALTVTGEQRLEGGARLRQRLATQQRLRAARGLQFGTASAKAPWISSQVAS